MNAIEKKIKLELWAEQNSITNESLFRIFEMLDRNGVKPEPQNRQNPTWYIHDSSASAWHTPSEYDWVELLRQNFTEIKKEALSVFEENLSAIHPENDSLVSAGKWNTFFFYKNGIKFESNHSRCPVTSDTISRIKGVDIAGRTYFSEMIGGTHIDKHCGPHNFKLRTQLGIKTPKDSFMSLSLEKKQWQEGECFVFDDSFEHEAINMNSESRIVLIVDVWNQTLSEIEISALKLIMPEFYAQV